MHALWLNILTEALPLSFFLQKEGSPSVARRLCPVYVPRRLRPHIMAALLAAKLPVDASEESLEPASWDSQNNLCGYCGDESDTARCKPCESTRLRIYRAVKADKELKKAWDGMKDKEALMAKAKDAYGDVLFKLLHTTLTEEINTEAKVTFVGTGIFMDVEDITEKYAKKTTRLAAVLKHSKRILCPTTKIELIEDMQYTSCAASSSTHTTTAKRELEGTEKIKKPKKPKVVKEEGEEPAEKEKSLTAAQLSHLQKYTEGVDAAYKKLGESYDPIKKSVDEKGWGMNVPQYIHTSHAAAVVKKTEFDARVEIIKDSQTCDWKALQSDVAELNSATKDLVRRTILQGQEAQSLGAKPKPRAKGKGKAKPKGKAL